MKPPRIRAVTFDLWDTLLVDDSDEPKRLSQGLLPKTAQRQNLISDFLHSHQPISSERLTVAYHTVDAAFHHVWQKQQVTWSVSDRLRILLAGLGRELPEDKLQKLVRMHEEMELEVRPDLAKGARQALEALHGKVRLGVVSDTMFSPGRVLRKILAAEGLLEFFDAFAFSDEVGRSKPHPSMFKLVAQALGVKPSEMVHLGDREQNDVIGPQLFGCQAILVTVVKDRRVGPSKAQAVCEDYARLPAIIQSLDPS